MSFSPCYLLPPLFLPNRPRYDSKWSVPRDDGQKHSKKSPLNLKPRRINLDERDNQKRWLIPRELVPVGLLTIEGHGARGQAWDPSAQRAVIALLIYNLPGVELPRESDQSRIWVIRMSQFFIQPSKGRACVMTQTEQSSCPGLHGSKAWLEQPQHLLLCALILFAPSNFLGLI